jgi:chromosome segregation ATPase
MSQNDQDLPDLADSIAQMAETTTAADLVRKQGQNKKVKVISERKLMEWIDALLRKHLAGRADSFSDSEKEALLKNTQDELARRIQREQVSEFERQRVQRELDAAVSQLSTAAADQGNQAEIATAIAALKAQADAAELARDEVQQDNYELQDQLQEKLALLGTTIAEKEKLRETVRGQMRRSTGLVEGVLGLDNAYYAGRHAEQNPVSDDASDDEQFYHDFDIGAKVINSLHEDLLKLREITAKVGSADTAQDQRLLAADLELLAQLKSGSVSALDVAAPVAGLIEALDGARAETEHLQSAIAEATGAPAQSTISALPDPDGEPAQVIAGATAVARELAAELARNRGRLVALKQIADEADAARNLGEDEIQHVLTALAAPDAAAAAIAAQALRAEVHSATAAVQQAQAALAAARADADRAQADADRAQAEVHIARAESARLTGEAEQSRHRADALRGVSQALIAGAKGDDRLADHAADLSLSLDEAEAPANLEQQVTAAAAALVERKRELLAELELARAEVDTLRNDANVSNRELATAQARLEQLRRDADDANAQARAAREEAIQAAADTDRQRAEIARVSAALDERLRQERRLAEEVAQACANDQALAGAGGGLTAALAAPRSEDGGHVSVQAELHRAVATLVARQQGAQQETTRIREDAGATRVALADLHQAAARALTQASADDEGLQEEARRIETALAGLPSDAPLPADHHRHLVDSLSRLAERSVALVAERDEIAAHGKEIIQTLTKQREAREAELKELRAEHTRTAAHVGDLTRRAQNGESSTRRLAEALSHLAAAAASGPTVQGLPPAQEVDEPRVDLELALSQLPAEGEEGITVPPDTAELLAEAGKRIAQAVANRQAAAVAALAKAEAEARTLRTEVQEQSSNSSRFTNDLGTLRSLNNELRAHIAAAKTAEERLEGELAKALANVSERDRLLAEVRREVESAQQGHVAAMTELSLRKAESDGLRTQLSLASEQLLQAQGRLDEVDARGGAAGDNVRDEVHLLRKDLSRGQEAQRRAEAAAHQANERAESSEAKLRRQRDEFTRCLEERDQVILEKDRVLDDMTRGRIDAQGMRAQIESLTAKLAAASDRLKVLESSHGERTSTDEVGREIERMQQERDHLRELKRGLEGDLAEVASVNEEFKTQLDEKRKELYQVREEASREITEERSRNVALREEFAKLKEEVIGLRARLRRLSGNGTGPL